jgi:hypothetical protein
MNNLLKFSIGIFITLGLAWLAFVVGAARQFGDLSPEAQFLEDDGSRPSGADLFPKDMSGLAKQGAKDYLSLGCMTCHTQQVRLWKQVLTSKGDGASVLPWHGTMSFRTMSCSEIPGSGRTWQTSGFASMKTIGSISICSSPNP